MLATDDIKDIEHRGADRLARQCRARGVDEQAGLNARLVRERAQSVLDGLGRPRLDPFEATGERGQKLPEARLLLQVLRDGLWVELEVVSEVCAPLARKIF